MATVKVKNSNNEWVDVALANVGNNNLPEEALTISGNCNYRFAYGGWDWFIDNYGGNIKTENITNAAQMFRESKVKKIPFEIDASNNKCNLSFMFYLSDIEESPIIKNMKLYNTSCMYDDCTNLRYVNDGCFENVVRDSQTSSASCNYSSMFSSCPSLRSISTDFFKPFNNAIFNTNTQSFYYNSFFQCYSLDELVDLPIVRDAPVGTQLFTNTIRYCYRVKDIIFKMNDDGSAKTVSWNNDQTLDLSKTVGYAIANDSILSANNGITADKEVVDDATYQALKDDPDWFSCNIAYSRYNRSSAIRTINSLPNCITSVFCTIKFSGDSGSATDGGAINTLTEEEIAVATAKGWTVSFV